MHLLAYLGLMVSIFEGVSLSCPSQCTCDSPSSSDGTGSRLVVCNDPDMYEIPTNVPVDTMKLRIEKTVIRKIPTEAFYYLVELKYLWVTYNSVVSIDTGSFYNLKYLHELRLDGNLLTAFPWESLLEMPNLRTLDLHNNRMTSVPVEATRYMKNLTYLDVSSNRLTTLPPDLLDTWTHFSADLGSRGMGLPPPRIILGLQDNPWFCDCHISKVMELSKVVDPTVVFLDPLLVCGGPERLTGILFQRAELEQCLKPSVMTSATKITSALGSNVLLRCDATGYPTPQLIWTRADNLPVNSTVIQETPGDGVRWSIISLTGISYKDAGDYSCKAKNLAGTSEAIVSVTVVGIVTTTIPPQKSGNKVGADQLLEEAKHATEKTTPITTSPSSPVTSSFSSSSVSSSSSSSFSSSSPSFSSSSISSSIITSTTIPTTTEISANTKKTSRKPPKSFPNGKKNSKVVMNGSKLPPASASKKEVSLLSTAAITEPGITIKNLKVVNETYESVTLTWKAINTTKNTVVTVLYSKYGEEDMIPLRIDSSESQVTIDGLEAGMQYVACVCPKGIPPKADQCITFSTDRMNEKMNSQISFLIVASSAACVVVLSLIFYLLYKVLRLQYKPKAIREDDLAKETYIQFETLSPRPHPTRELWTRRRTDESERLLLCSRSSVDSPMTYKNEGSRSEYYC
ncbi:leucine-rich repeat, immunoglobulin-like domain and transmembrane domain-containing protein 3 [Phascolarctos cinereus]|uniref:leucine-rich repeat, immunoglobulin-like domain and transmembrane domain-containing protein 3 n=1 Tax=Phascolarctos cinereus TaxID=38626 RepID=UPI000A286FD6|nr:leucine-rich repeat, immunoglobulin-like domain and transmembrane domain-containing protein 3 [Phascolarctos cinereus]